MATMGTEAGRAILCADPDLSSGIELALLLECLGRAMEIAESGNEALAGVERLRPSLIILAADLPHPCSFEVLHRIRLLYGHSMMIAFVAAKHDSSPRDEVAALLLGADEYFARPLQRDSVLARTRRLLSDPRRPPDRRAETRDRTQLTPREREVLALLIDGERTDAIARQLYITGKTASTHIERILGKLGAHSRAHAVAIALREQVLNSGG
jgi:DNA-binding NarL/FixJ family response regulator